MLQWQIQKDFKTFTFKFLASFPQLWWNWGHHVNLHKSLSLTLLTVHKHFHIVRYFQNLSWNFVAIEIFYLPDTYNAFYVFQNSTFLCLFCHISLLIHSLIQHLTQYRIWLSQLPVLRSQNIHYINKYSLDILPFSVSKLIFWNHKIYLKYQYFQMTFNFEILTADCIIFFQNCPIIQREKLHSIWVPTYSISSVTFYNCWALDKREYLVIIRDDF